ncbi:hypothetical protein FV242_32335 [Methylobacterium sp. WL64]|uniref:hypothetical protein n=1 Tax=Methylobacterium sp. WL64 TaxID=2603894 RepID=UPI0011C9E8EE|nr:hypothetical protein [Methylobacterium sp. WL64]TXM97125.1 hypothetical protein FV242_32335 [Methylobacterium sp. WL64]
MSRLKTHDRYIKFNIAEAFEYVLNENNPRFSRAVRLYEIQTAVLIGRKLLICQERGKEYPNNWVRVSRAALSAARTVVRVRLFEHIIAEKHPDAGRLTPLKKLVRDKDAIRLLRQMITPKKSEQMAYSFSWRQLDQLLTTRRIEQTTYAPLYYISLHFAIFGGSNSRCNWSRAAATLLYSPEEIEYTIIRKHFKTLFSSSTAYKYKDEDNHFAAFIWLDHFGGRFLRPPRPIAASFVEKLLKKVDDTAGLKNYIAQYEYVRLKFKSQDYDLPQLRLVDPIEPQKVSVSPLPEELTAII